eukprot:tig00020909_g15362.t1
MEKSRSQVVLRPPPFALAPVQSLGHSQTLPELGGAQRKPQKQQPLKQQPHKQQHVQQQQRPIRSPAGGETDYAGAFYWAGPLSAGSKSSPSSDRDKSGRTQRSQHTAASKPASPETKWESNIPKTIPFYDGAHDRHLPPAIRARYEHLSHVTRPKGSDTLLKLRTMEAFEKERLEAERRIRIERQREMARAKAAERRYLEEQIQRRLLEALEQEKEKRVEVEVKIVLDELAQTVQDRIWEAERKENALKAATTIQASYRAYLIRMRLANLAYATLTVQRVIRGFLARRRVKRLRRERLIKKMCRGETASVKEAESLSAMMIQCAWRMGQTRRSYIQMMDAVLELARTAEERKLAVPLPMLDNIDRIARKVGAERIVVGVRPASRERTVSRSSSRSSIRAGGGLPVPRKELPSSGVSR